MMGLVRRFCTFGLRFEPRARPAFAHDQAASAVCWPAARLGTVIFNKRAQEWDRGKKRKRFVVGKKRGNIF